MVSETRVSELSEELQKELRALGRKLGIAVTPDTTLSFFDAENIRDRKLQQRAEKALKKAERQVLAMAALHLQHRVPAPHASHPHPPKAVPLPQVDLRTPSVRERIVSKLPLTLEQSRQLLVEGNRAFVSGLARMFPKVAARSVTATTYDVLLLVCSDARSEITQLDNYKDQRVLVVQVAGNVSGTHLRSALAKLKDGGEIVVCGHTNCGACNAKQATQGHGETSKNLEKLLAQVDVTAQGNASNEVASSRPIYAANVLNQVHSLQGNAVVRQKHLSVVPAIFDPSERSHPFKLLEPFSSAFVSSLRASASERLAEAEREGKDVATQYAHAVVLAPSDLLGRVSDPRLVFGAGINELFSVATVGRKLSPEAVASIEYAILHVAHVDKTAHLVIVNSDIDRARAQLNTLLGISDIVRSKTQNGKTVTLGRFNPATGEVLFVS